MEMQAHCCRRGRVIIAAEITVSVVADITAATSEVSTRGMRYVPGTRKMVRASVRIWVGKLRGGWYLGRQTLAISFIESTSLEHPVRAQDYSHSLARGIYHVQLPLINRRHYQDRATTGVYVPFDGRPLVPCRGLSFPIWIGVGGVQIIIRNAGRMLRTTNGARQHHNLADVRASDRDAVRM